MIIFKLIDIAFTFPFFKNLGVDDYMDCTKCQEVLP